MRLLYDQRALGELSRFKREVQKDFQAQIEVLKQEGKLDPPGAKKITRELFEVRVVKEGAYRGFYAYVGKEYIVILHFFHKKTQKTPSKNIKIARRRLKYYE